MNSKLLPENCVYYLVCCLSGHLFTRKQRNFMGPIYTDVRSRINMPFYSKTTMKCSERHAYYTTNYKRRHIGSCYRNRERNCSGEGLSKVKSKQIKFKSFIMPWLQHRVEPFLPHLPSKPCKSSLWACGLMCPSLCSGQNFHYSCSVAPFLRRGNRGMQYGVLFLTLLSSVNPISTDLK